MIKPNFTIAVVAATACACTVAIAQQARAQADPCNVAFAELDTAMRQADVPAVERLGYDVNGIAGCDADRRTGSRRRAARWLAAVARQAGPDQPARLDAARRAYPVWEVLSALGDIAFGWHDYSMAGPLYERALNDMLHRYPGDPGVPPATLLAMQRRAAEVDMLAPALPPPLRDGSPGGLDAMLMLDGSRDLAVQPRLLPVTFVYARADMTPEGADFAAKWQESLRGANLPALLLAGHTDPTGNPALNEILSVRRAEALAMAMHAGGFAGTIGVAGYGARCPMTFTADYTEAEQNQILRRVEVFNGDALPPAHCGGAVPRRS